MAAQTVENGLLQDLSAWKCNCMVVVVVAILSLLSVVMKNVLVASRNRSMRQY